jgi:hypothetical protein
MSESGDRLRRLLVIALLGISAGVLTLLGQGVLDANWNRLANSGAVWLMVGFLAGSRMPSISWAVVAGIATLIAAIAGYYAAAVVVALPESAHPALPYGAPRRSWAVRCSGSPVAGGMTLRPSGERSRLA